MKAGWGTHHIIGAGLFVTTNTDLRVGTGYGDM